MGVVGEHLPLLVPYGVGGRSYRQPGGGRDRADHDEQCGGEHHEQQTAVDRQPVPQPRRRCSPTVRRQGCTCRSTVVELVAHLVDRQQVDRGARVGLDLLAQVKNVYVDGSLGDVGVGAPADDEQLTPCEDPSRLGGHGGEKVEFAGVHKPAGRRR